MGQPAGVAVAGRFTPAVLAGRPPPQPDQHGRAPQPPQLPACGKICDVGSGTAQWVCVVVFCEMWVTFSRNGVCDELPEVDSAYVTCYLLKLSVEP